MSLSQRMKKANALLAGLCRSFSGNRGVPEGGTDRRATTVLVAATHRSGSYLTCDWLAQLGRLPFPEEHFNFNMKSARQELCLAESVTAQEVLEKLIDQRTRSGGCFTVKAMWPAFASLFSNLALASGDDPGAFHQQAFHFLGRPKILFVRRRDKVRQAVSFEIAKQTGVWRREKGEKLEEPCLLYSFPRILACWEQIHQDESAWLDFFERHGLSYHEMWYEDLVADPNEQIRQALRFLDRDVQPDLLLASRFERISQGLNRDWAERFHKRHQSGPVQEPLPERGSRIQVSMRPLEPRIQMAPNATGIVHCELKNTGSEALTPALYPNRGSDHTIELRESSSPARKALWRSELERSLSPGESTIIPLRLKLATRLDGLDCDLVFGYPGGEQLVPQALHVAIEFDEKWSHLARIFPAIHPSEMYHWIWIEHFGDVWIENFPFLFIHEHGWLKVDPEDSMPGLLCVEDFALGKIKVNLERPREFLISQIASRESSQTLEFLGFNGKKRQFRDSGTGERLDYPLSYGPDTAD